MSRSRARWARRWARKRTCSLHSRMQVLPIPSSTRSPKVYRSRSSDFEIEKFTRRGKTDERNFDRIEKWPHPIGQVSGSHNPSCYSPSSGHTDYQRFLIFRKPWMFLETKLFQNQIWINFYFKCLKYWKRYLNCFTENGVEKGVLLQKLTEVGSTYGTIQFPPMLTPVPAKPTLFDIAGDKGTDFNLMILNVFYFLFYNFL